MSFKAIVVRKSGDRAVDCGLEDVDDEMLSKDGDVTVAVEYSSLNYKDGLCLQGLGGLVREYPHIPGIDFAGTVESSTDPRFQQGDKVILTGWRVGEVWCGGFSQKARVKADWLVPLPNTLTTRQSMAIGTAGLTAMLAVQALEAHAVTPDNGAILVTGAAGGVGSIATAILANSGYSVDAVTGRPELENYLKSLGAKNVIPRSEVSGLPEKPLGKERWAGCIDAVGGNMLAHVLSHIKYGGSVAAVGLAGGSTLQTTVIPFLLRGVNLLGIDSVLQPFENREKAWNRIATVLPQDILEAMVVPAILEDIPTLGEKILAGEIRGRVVIEIGR